MQTPTAAQEIDAIITLYGGWKGQILTQLRTAILSADPTITEAVKWKMRTRPEGLPVWMSNGNVCLVETFKDDIKLVFVKGALMSDYQQHFNARLNSSTDRAIQFKADDHVDQAVIRTLVAAGVLLNNK